MIPPDYADVSQESPREICGNLAQTFRGLAASGYMRGIDRGPFISYTDWSRWADRLERACQRIDEQRKIAPSLELFEKLVDSNCMAFCWKFSGARPLPEEHTPLCNRANEALRALLGAVSPTAPPAEQDTPQ